MKGFLIFLLIGINIGFTKSIFISPNDLTFRKNHEVGYNDVSIYMDKVGDIWYVKKTSLLINGYVGCNLIHTIAEHLDYDIKVVDQRIVYGLYNIIATKKLNNFKTLAFISASDKKLNNIDIWTAIFIFLGMVDLHHNNLGIISINNIYDISIVDLDSIFIYSNNHTPQSILKAVSKFTHYDLHNVKLHFDKIKNIPIDIFQKSIYLSYRDLRLAGYNVNIDKIYDSFNKSFNVTF